MELVGAYLEREQNKPAGHRAYSLRDFLDQVKDIMSYEQKPLHVRQKYDQVLITTVEVVVE